MRTLPPPTIPGCHQMEMSGDYEAHLVCRSKQQLTEQLHIRCTQELGLPTSYEYRYYWRALSDAAPRWHGMDIKVFLHHQLLCRRRRGAKT